MNPRIVFLSAIVAFALLSPLCLGHNWVGQKSRNSGTASQIAPCQARRSPKPQVQIANNGQEFQMEWASGHSRPAYFVLIRAEDRAKLADHSRDLLDQYIDDALAAGSPNLMLDSPGVYNRYQKFHRFFSDSRTVPNDLYAERINPGHPMYFERDPEFTSKGGNPGEQLRYQADALEDDVYIRYAHPEYDWIDTVWRFEVEEHWPRDYDFAWFKVPEGAEPGEWIIHYRWAGFFDCVDLDVVDQVTDVANTFGIRNDSLFDEMRVDHCLFQNPKAYFPPAIEVIDGNIESCIRRCQRRSGRGCNGIQLLPAVLPDTVPQAWRDVWSETLLHRYIRDSYYPANWTKGIEPDRYNDYFDDPTLYSDQAVIDAQLQAYLDGGPDKLYCLPIQQMDATDTQSALLTTNDPRVPEFYGTCYVRLTRVDFIGYEEISPAGQTGPVRYEDLCVDCNSFHQAGTTVAPTWSILRPSQGEVCRDCNDIPAPEPEPVGTLVPRWSKAYFAVGNQDPNQGAPVDYRPSWHESCTDPLETCEIKLGGVNWGWRDVEYDAHECAKLAANETGCIPGTYWIDPVRSESNTNRGRFGCHCLKNLACCMDDPSTDLYNVGVYNNQDDSVVTYEYLAPGETPTPDPTCATGMLSTIPDGEFCCPAWCNECRASSGNRFCRPLFYVDVANTDYFNGQNRTCDTYGPPCVM